MRVTVPFVLFLLVATACGPALLVNSRPTVTPIVEAGPTVAPPTRPPTAAAFASPVPTPTGTPTRPLSPSSGALPCAIAATRTPPPSAPTIVSTGGVVQVDPHIELCASARSLQVGETVTIVGMPVDIGLPYYQLLLKAGGNAEWVLVAQVTYDNQLKPASGAVPVFELVSAKGAMRQVIFVLRAQSPGTADIRIGATGEVHYGYPGPATWAGGGSDSISLTVAGP